MSRCVQGRHLLGEAEQAQFRRMLEKAVLFSGLELITFCIMHNHFHVLVRVPTEAPAVTDAVLVERYAALYGDTPAWQSGRNRGGNLPTPAELAKVLQTKSELAERWRIRLLRRMHSIAEFMRTLKLRYSTWYNKTHSTYGTFWANRYHAVWVEGKPHALETVAAYIDMNPVRAGLVDQPQDYRFSGFGEAMSGTPPSGVGLTQILIDFGRTPEERLLAYAGLLRGRVARIRPEAAGEPFSVGSPRRIAAMTRGLVLGSASFVRKLLPSQPTPIRVQEDCPEKDPARTLFAGCRTR